MIFLNSGTGNRELTIQFFYVIGISALSTDSTVVCFQYDIVGHIFMEQAFEPDLLQKLHLFFSIGEPQ